ncbi:MAG TPA: hypothetical protein VGA80_01360 [Flavobacteriaceae bacterium]
MKPFKTGKPVCPQAVGKQGKLFGAQTFDSASAPRHVETVEA